MRNINASLAFGNPLDPLENPAENTDEPSSKGALPPHPATVFERRPSRYPVRKIEAAPLPADMAAVAAAWTRPQTALERRLDALARDVEPNAIRPGSTISVRPALRSATCRPSPTTEAGEILEPVSEPLPGPACGSIMAASPRRRTAARPSGWR